MRLIISGQPGNGFPACHRTCDVVRQTLRNAQFTDVKQRMHNGRHEMANVVRIGRGFSGIARRLSNHLAWLQATTVEQ